MTVQVNRSISDLQEGDGANRIWDFGFKIELASHAFLVVYDADGNPTEYTGADITVAGLNQDAGGTVTFPTDASGDDPLPAGYSVVVLRRQPFVQPDRIGNQGRFFPEIHEAAFDRLTEMLQQVRDFGTSISLRLPPGDPVPGENDTFLPLASVRAGKFLEFDETGKPVSLRGVADLDAAAETATTQAGIATEQAVIATDQATLSATARAASEAARDASATSANAASDSATLAQLWANEDEDVVVAGGEFSAKHWAAKAQELGAEQAALAEQWANEDEDVEVEPGLFSAKHWAAKAALAAAGNAVNIAFTPAGTIAAVNVQAAIEEVSGDVSTLSDAVDEKLAIANKGTSAEIVAGADDDKYVTAKAVHDAIAALLPSRVGEIIIVLNGDAPADALLLDGSLVSRTTYATLWAKVNTGSLVTEATWLAGWVGRYSSGDTATNFRLPDMRGIFMRGTDRGKGLDGSATTAPGIYSADTLKTHTHPYADSTFGGASDGGSGGSASGSFDANRTTGNPSTGTAAETKPKNVAVDYYVRFK